MATELTMPQMGYDMKEGTLVRWLKAEGEEVSIGEAVAEIETDKAVVEFESTEAGILHKLLVVEGDVVPVGQAVALVGAAGEEVSIDSEVAPSDSLPSVEEEQEIDEPTPAVDTGPSDVPVQEPPTNLQEVRASPIARRLAAERGVELSQVKGTGPGGRITKKDVLSVEPSQAPTEVPVISSDIESPAPASPVSVADEVVPLTRMRAQIARVTTRSKTEIPHFYVTTQIDMSDAMALRRQINDNLKDDGVRVSVNDLIIKACVNTLKKYPKLNAYFSEEGIELHSAINVGIAIAEEDGLTMPAILDCGSKSLAQIAAASDDLIQRTQSGTLQPDEYTGGTFSISNMGMFEVTSFAAIIQPPQSAVLAVGTVQKIPVIRDDQVTVSEVMNATLSVDHRVSDGAEGARFIVEVKNQLENPLKLVM
ncbi:MAG: 2-oxo acid dehydrogenase subunit E2 [SAR202 cluster bacterium]|nr:2-oxo acid dehydrogenase subunit E2 [SAR202 cluster bacterium]